MSCKIKRPFEIPGALKANVVYIMVKFYQKKMKRNLRPEKSSSDRTHQLFRRIFEIKTMPTFQLVGEILARAQLLEELMRAYIVNGSKKYNHPRQVRGTFGQLKMNFKKIYSREKNLLDCLDSANETRNDIAHNSFLIDWFVKDLLRGYKEADIDRFNHKGLEKMLDIMDSCLVEFQKFMKRVSLKTYDLKISQSRPILFKRTISRNLARAYPKSDLDRPTPR